MAGVRRCIVCDREGPFALFFRQGREASPMVRCPDCGLVFQDPQPSDEVLAGSYYHDPEFSALLAGPLRELTLARGRQKLTLLRGANVGRSGLRTLDVGCSSGAWLEVAAAGGLTAEGVELGETTAAQARTRGLRVHTGTLASCFDSLASEPFDLITFWDVLEHVRDPRAELALAEQLLAPGGLLAATFPNVEGWYPRATYSLIARRTGVWEYPELPVHLYDFSPGTARRLLARAGFETMLMKTVPTPFSFYRQTTLSRDRLGRGARALGLRLAFELLRITVYPAARLCGRDNSLFVVASRLSSQP